MVCIQVGQEISGRASWLLLTHPVLLQGYLLGEALLGKVANRIVVRVGQEMRQVVPRPGKLL